MRIKWFHSEMRKAMGQEQQILDEGAVDQLVCPVRQEEIVTKEGLAAYFATIVGNEGILTGITLLRVGPNSFRVVTQGLTSIATNDVPDETQQLNVLGVIKRRRVGNGSEGI